MKTFILYVLITNNICAPTWVSNGDFSSYQNCTNAARQLGASAKPQNFKCLVK